MIYLTINNKKHPITEEPTIDQWQRIVNLDFEYRGHWVDIIHYATGVERPILERATEEQLRLGAVLVAYAMGLRKECPIQNFEELNLGQWIDLEYYLALGLPKSIRQCLDTLGVDTDDASQALWVIEKYSQWRSNIYRQYEGLFHNEVEAESEPTKPINIAKAWYRILVELANNDPLKIDSITEEPVKKMFNFMAVQKEKQLEELNQKRQQHKEYELQANRR